MSTGKSSRRRGASELALGAAALAMAVGAFAGHALVPERVADHYGWVSDRWYQREIGAFNAGLGYGIVAYARGRREAAFSRIVVDRGDSDGADSFSGALQWRPSGDGQYCDRRRGCRPGCGRSDADAPPA